MLVMPSASAHDASTYIVLLRGDGPMPANATSGLYTNDSVMFRDVDSTTGVQHRVLMDGDADGAHDNASVDWDSGWLNETCELDADGNKTDADCQVTFIVDFNGSGPFGAGTYRYTVESSYGTVFNGSLTISTDSHADDGAEHGHLHGDHEHADSAESDDLLAAIGGTQTLLFVSATTCLIALTIFARLGSAIDAEHDAAIEKQRRLDSGSEEESA